MRQEAASAGFYEAKYSAPGAKNQKYPRLQILTVAELLAGKRVDCPPFVRLAARSRPRRGIRLFFTNNWSSARRRWRRSRLRRR